MSKKRFKAVLNKALAAMRNNGHDTPPFGYHFDGLEAELGKISNQPFVSFDTDPLYFAEKDRLHQAIEKLTPKEGSPVPSGEKLFDDLSLMYPHKITRLDLLKGRELSETVPSFNVGKFNLSDEISDKPGLQSSNNDSVMSTAIPETIEDPLYPPGFVDAMLSQEGMEMLYNTSVLAMQQSCIRTHSAFKEELEFRRAEKSLMPLSPYLGPRYSKNK